MICKLCAYQPLHVHRTNPTYDQTYCEQCGHEDKIILQIPRKPKEQERSMPKMKESNGSRKRLRSV